MKQHLQSYLSLFIVIAGLLLPLEPIAKAITDPTTQASNLTIDATTSTSVSISWTRGDGDEVLVIARADADALVDPADGTTYAANATFGSGDPTGTGNFAVYSGTGTSVTVTGLNALTTYHFYAYEYNTGGSPDPDYLLTSPATNSATTDCSAPTSQPSGISFSATTNSSMNVAWTGGDGDQTLVVARAGSAVDADPVVGVSYTADPIFGSGSEIGTGNFVVYAGSGDNVTVTGLSGSNTYHYAVYEFNTAGNCYLLTSPTTDNQTTDCTPPTGQASSITFSNTNSASMQVNWTRGTPAGDGVIVIARANNPVSFTPSNGDDYAGDVNADFSSATNFGGNRIVFRSSGTSVNVTGLSSSTTYHFAVYEYNNAGDCYNLNSPPTGSNATTGVDNNSTITDGTSSSNTISSMTNGVSPAEVFSFTINDIGGDGRDTDFSAIIFREVLGQVTDLTQLIAGAELTDGTNTQSTNVTINTDNITITNIPTNNNLGDVNDGASKTYTLSIWFLNSFVGSLPTTFDVQRLVFSVDEADITTPADDSQFAPGQSATSDDIGGPNNEIAVVASELSFVQQPTNTIVLSVMSPAVTIEATDARGNRDLDYAGT
ncbi:MAG: hypothetical protein R3345_00545, partial [Fulvivirga sp.]|nr:hypothetical protein [Fulvivirga sp.]